MKFLQARRGLTGLGLTAGCSAPPRRYRKRSLAPIAEKLDLVPHGLDGHNSTKMQYPTQLFSHREPLLRRQNHSGVFFARGVEILGVKSIEVRDVNV